MCFKDQRNYIYSLAITGQNGPAVQVFMTVVQPGIPEAHQPPHTGMYTGGAYLKTDRASVSVGGAFSAYTLVLEAPDFNSGGGIAYTINTNPVFQTSTDLRISPAECLDDLP